jgi:hypothetical protein
LGDNIRRHSSALHVCQHPPYIRRHTSAHVSIRQHSSALHVCQHLPYIRRHTSAYVSIRRLFMYASIRPVERECPW